VSLVNGGGAGFSFRKSGRFRLSFQRLFHRDGLGLRLCLFFRGSAASGCALASGSRASALTTWLSRLFRQSTSVGIGAIVVLDVLNGGCSVMFAENPLLVTNEFLLESKAFFQLLQPENIVTHLLVGKDLGGCGLTAALESTLLAIEKILPEANQLSYLFELKNVFLQVLGQAAAFGIGLGGTLLHGTALLAKKPANASQLLQPVEAPDKYFPAQQDKLLEVTIATLGFKKLALELGKLLLDFAVATLALLHLAQKEDGIDEIAVIARDRRHRRHRIFTFL